MVEMLEGVDQVMVGPAVDVKAHIPRGAELLQMVSPLCLVVNAVPDDYLAYLVTGPHSDASKPAWGVFPKVLP
jgi:hypothetical protein